MGQTTGLNTAQAAEHWTPADGDCDLGAQWADLRRAIEALTAAIEKFPKFAL